MCRGFRKINLLIDQAERFAPEHLAHIFKRFYQASSSHGQTGGSGSGLGLAIVEWIVRMHGGSVEVESRIGWGSTFVVTLPLSITSVNRATLRFPAGA